MCRSSRHTCCKKRTWQQIKVRLTDRLFQRTVIMDGRQCTCGYWCRLWCWRSRWTRPQRWLMYRDEKDPTRPHLDWHRSLQNPVGLLSALSSLERFPEMKQTQILLYFYINTEAWAEKNPRLFYLLVPFCHVRSHFIGCKVKSHFLELFLFICKSVRSWRRTEL